MPEVQPELDYQATPRLRFVNRQVWVEDENATHLHGKPMGVWISKNILQQMWMRTWVRELENKREMVADIYWRDVPTEEIT
jgi:hypothetical protein